MRRLAIRRPRLVLALWGTVIGLLALGGLGVEKRLNRTDIMPAGSDAAEAQELARKHFGDSANLVVLVEGPRSRLDRQARRLARRLDAMDDVSVLGPWMPGASRALPRERNRVAILVRAERPFGETAEHLVPPIRRTVDAALDGQVSGYVTGYPDIASGIHNASVSALTRAEVIAAPLLLIVLLLVFRSPVAAALPLFVGFATIGAGKGLLDLLNRLTDLDVVSLNMASMMGLALGVDYSLVLVSRYREELEAGRDPKEAAAVTVGTAGRTVVFAGVALAVSSATALAIAPSAILKSAGTGVLASTALSVFAGLTALPALLMLAGPHLDRWRFGGRGAGGGAWGGVALRTLRRPALAAAVVLVLIAALSSPALGLSTGSPDPRNLPESARERQDFQHIVRVFGPGWSAPYEIVLATDRGPITDRRRLAALSRWQDRLARDPRVEAVMGPGEIAQRTRPLERVEKGLGRMGGELRRARRDQTRLAGGLERARSGASELGDGLVQASEGAGRLRDGAGGGAGGAERLRRGLDRVRRGTERLQAGLAQAGAGAGALASGSHRLRSGAGRVQAGLATAGQRSRASLPRVAELRQGLEQGAAGLERLRDPARTANTELQEALSALDAMLPTSKVDPAYARAYKAVATASGAVSGRHPQTGQPVAEGYDGLDAGLGTAASEAGRAAAGVGRLEAGTGSLIRGMDRMAAGTARLQRGVERLNAGTQRLREGLDRLGSGGVEVPKGLGRLQAGGGELASGTRRLAAGAGELETGLRTGAERTGELRSGVEQMRDGVVAARSRSVRLGRQLGAGTRVNTQLFRSGYLTLSALDGAPRGARTASSFAVNIDGGGSATRVVVIEDGVPIRSDNPLRPRLERAADDIARDTGTKAAVGGPAATLQDFDDETAGRLGLLIAALALITYLVLVPILRSLLLPLFAVLLNVLTVLAAFGVLVLGFQGSAPLGGAGELDAMMVMSIYAIVFGLSIDYEVFLLARMQEGYARTGTSHGAIEYGLRTTAGVITGAAMIMIGVFAAFASAEIASMRQLGIGLTVAVLLDATVVRLILLPALIRLAGPAAWWLPSPLGRMLPQPRLEGTSG